MLWTAAAITAAWCILIGVPYVARTRRIAMCAALAAYLVLALGAVAVLGPGWQGYAGATGLLLPLAGGLAVGAVKPRRRPGRVRGPRAPPRRRS